VRHGF